MEDRARSVLITGASSGIGRAAALRLDRLGWRVFAGVRRPADSESLARQGSGRLAPLPLEVTDAAQIESAAKAVAAAVGDGGLQGLVNNAGIGVGSPIEFLPLAALRRQLEVNVVGLVAVTQAFMPLVRGGRGRVVHVSSIGGRVSAPFLGAYGASKFAVEAIADAQRRELRPFGIHVALIEPGAIDTPIFEKSKAEAQRMLAEMPARGRELYDPDVQALFRTVDRNAAGAIPPERVARVIEHALTAARPRTRYLVGTDARVQALLGWLLPDRWMDAVFAWSFGQRRRA